MRHKIVFLILFIVAVGAIVADKLAKLYVFRTVGKAVRRVLDDTHRELTPDQRDTVAAIVAAQAGYETGHGVAPAWLKGNNFGNVTAGASWAGPVVEGGDKEYDTEGNVRSIVQRFRAYATVDDAARDFLALLSWNRYRPARDALFRGDSTGYVAALRAGGYFTAPLDSYTRAVNNNLAAAASAVLSA